MDKNALSKIATPYDVKALSDRSKKLFRKIVFQISIYALLLVLSILAIIFLGQYLWVFILGIVVACVSAFMCIKQFKKISFADCSNVKGEIVDVFKEITTVRSITGGYGMYVTRKYDAFAKSAIRLTISVKNEDEVRSYVLERATEEHAKYYESKGEVILIPGTHFPVKLEIGKDEWLCPICGEFNAVEERSCVNCKEKVLK